MGSAVAKWGGVLLDQAAPISWTMTRGTAPWVESLIFDKEQAKKITTGESYALSIEADVEGTTEKLEVKNLYAMAIAPSIDDFRTTWIVADERIFWRRRHVVRRYNIRTRTGSRRRVDPDGDIPEEIEPVVDDIFYKKFSLNNGAAWTATDILKDVLPEVLNEGTSYRIVGEFDDVRYVDNLEIDDQGDSALATVLSYISGAEIYLDKTGTVVVYNRYDLEKVRDLKADLDRERPRLEGTPPDVFQDLKNIRPSKVNVLFTVEQEMRFDSFNSETDPASLFGEDGRFCDNVLPVPDADLQLVGGEKVPQGTWITFEEAFAAWNADKGDRNIIDISHEEVRKQWMGPYLESYFGGMGTKAPSVSWIYRIAAIRRYYRRAYRINRLWTQKFYSLKPYRVSVLDLETGQFAASSVFMDWTVVFNERGIFANVKNGANVHLTFLSSPESPNQKLSVNSATPATLQVVDPDLGIFMVDIKSDLLGHVSRTVPGRLLKGASMDAEEWGDKSYFTDGTSGDEGSPQSIAMDPLHRLTFVFSFVPGAPNSSDQLFSIPVDFADVEDYLPKELRGAGNATGPEWTIRAGPQIATARFGWSESSKTEIVESLIGEGSDRSGLDFLLQNPRELEELAEAMSAGLYASMLDRIVMERTVVFYPDIEIVGNVARIVHTLDQNGLVTTHISAPDESPPIDPMALLSSGARRVFQRMVVQE